ncbi:hypothetical protein OHB11_18295 [Streptomyces zaomyceticus]|uniref:Uncharacterized protein n=1 Tax=Streptomyces zaomyceticus TaxID=68286 RepID=A0ABZ1LEE5_9ACTN|nr:hypothetical protein OG237_23240 [Streptomyces zaomyceticus]
MDASEVSSLHTSMRKYGIPGVLEPVDPRNRAGVWRVVDPVDRRDITVDVLARVAAADRHRPTRGFVISG